MPGLELILQDLGGLGEQLRELGLLLGGKGLQDVDLAGLGRSVVEAYACFYLDEVRADVLLDGFDTLVAATAAEDFKRELAQKYKKATGKTPEIYVCRASAGAGVLDAAGSAGA